MSDNGDSLVDTMVLLLAALRATCRCNEPETNPPTAWVTSEQGARIPHHCDCPLYPIELPSADTTPEARADALRVRDHLLTEQSGS